jgi:cytochrome P450
MLYASSGEKWKSHRKIIAPTFHLNVLKSFIDLFNTNSRAVCEKMAKENGKHFDCHDYMSECTVEILLGKSKALFHWFSTCEPKYIKVPRASAMCKAKL